MDSEPRVYRDDPARSGVRREPGLVAVLLGLVLVASSGCGGEPGETPDPALPESVERVANPSGGRWAPGEEWRVMEELRIGSVGGEGPDVWGSVGGITVDGGGRLWVLDNQAHEIRVFTSGGRHVRSVGREGEGPGEIALGAALLTSPRGDIWLHDARNRRFTVYDTTGAHVRDHPIRSVRFLQGHRFSNGGDLLQLVAVERGGEREVVLVRGRVADGGELRPVDTLPVPEMPEPETMVVRFQQGELRAIRAAPLPFIPRPQRILDPRGFVWTTAVDGSFRLVQHDLRAEPVRVVERPYEPVPVTPDERARALEPFRDADLDEDRIPDVHPPFESVHVTGDGHLWVWRHAGRGRMAWDVFDPRGRYLGEVATPWDGGRFRLLALEPEALYGVWLDELDVSWVVRLRVVRPEG